MAQTQRSIEDHYFTKNHVLPKYNNIPCHEDYIVLLSPSTDVIKDVDYELKITKSKAHNRGFIIVGLPFIDNLTNIHCD